jgi:hypothetical protein
VKDDPGLAVDHKQRSSADVDSGSVNHASESKMHNSSSANYPPSFEFLNVSGNLKKFVYNEQSKRAFVSADVINFRLKPGGGLLGQLSKGDALEILTEPDQSGFMKVRTSYGQVGYVSKDLVSMDRAFGVFDSDRLVGTQSTDLVISIGPGQDAGERSRHYSFFLELLDRLPTKASFDFSKSNLRYMILASSEILYPADPSNLLNLIRQSSFKPAIFLERAKMANQASEGGMIIKTKLPVRRVPANQGGQSTSIERIDISTKCYPFRMNFGAEQSGSSKLELVVIDIKKSMNVTFTTRPHKGDPNFTWAFADLNGDTWQDVAIYFGGQTSVSPYKFLFIAQNVGGIWQIHRVEDRSGYNQNCA